MPIAQFLVNEIQAFKKLPKPENGQGLCIAVHRAQQDAVRAMFRKVFLHTMYSQS